ncbi:MAG: DUF4126 family protein [Chthoniobacterales bacterium]
MNIIFLCLGIGFVAGLRSMLAPAVVSWAAYLGWLHLGDSGLRFMASPISVAAFSLLALGELIADKLPFIPKRTEPGPLVVRLVSGGLSGACLGWSANQSWTSGAAAGAIGAIIGAFAGYHLRRRLTLGAGLKDFCVALPEDLLAIALACYLVSR